MRRIALTAFVAALALLAPAPASAHYYCGHSSDTDYFPGGYHYDQYRYGWNEWVNGTLYHFHRYYTVTRYWSEPYATEKWVTRSCPRH